MNNQRRKEIATALELMQKALDILEPTQSDEQKAYENMPESLQNSERGEISQTWCDVLDNVVNNLQGDIDALGSVE